uniref:transcription factor bHLH121-like isoform X2 n=1 Tax=Erigeron canadensis TaxID=72917 RepID=UPI001CB8AEF8|nr:transcription factor bHLH121-like isoform X2 [Erigeron canadensis]
MDHWKPKLEVYHQHQHQHQYILNDHREMIEVVVNDANDARKVQKADREKLRRDRLNEQFTELGNLLDPERPRNDKASIVVDTIQVLKDLTAEVNKLKAEYAELAEESCELTQEKNELKEEKLSLNSDIENAKAQYQQRIGALVPWGVGDHSSVVTPPPYSFPVALPVPSVPVSMQLFPFFTNHNMPGAVPTSSQAFLPYPNTANTHINQSIPVYEHTSYSSSKQECRSNSSDRFRGSNDERGDNAVDVATELELKTPGSRSCQDSSTGHNKRKQSKRDCSNNRYTSSQGFQDSSSNSEVDNNGGV